MSRLDWVSKATSCEYGLIGALDSARLRLEVRGHADAALEAERALTEYQSRIAARSVRPVMGYQPTDAEIDESAAFEAVVDVADDIAADVLAELTGQPADAMLDRVKALTTGVRDDDWDEDDVVAIRNPAPAGNGSVPTFAFDESDQ